MVHQNSASSNIKLNGEKISDAALVNIGHRPLNHSETKTYQFDTGLRGKRKRLQSVRVRNALRNNSRDKRKKTSSPISSDDSVDDVNYNSKRRRTSNLLIQSQRRDTRKNLTPTNEGQTTDTEAMQMSIINETVKATEKLTNRLNICSHEQTDCSQCSDYKDLSENSDFLLIQEKSKNRDSPYSKFDGDGDGDDASITSGRTFQCPLCVAKTFRQVDLLIRHLLRGHNLDLDNNDLNNLKYLIMYKQNEISITVTPPQFSRPFSLARCKTKRKFTEKRSNLVPIISHNNYQLEKQETEWNSKARADGTFTCLKCDFKFGNEQGFYEHIKRDHVWTEEEIHRLKENGAETEPILEFWCPECSGSFVTKSSLSMHLKASHEFLSDIQLYLEKIGYDGEIPMAENQCNICYIVEEGPKEFEKHVRSHGLAFLRRQQLLSKLRTFK